MEVDSTMSYLGQKLRVSLENAELFVVLELVQAPSVGEITRAGFVEGWKATRYIFRQRSIITANTNLMITGLKRPSKHKPLMFRI
jgi:hypothetical protein